MAEERRFLVPEELITEERLKKGEAYIEEEGAPGV